MYLPHVKDFVALARDTGLVPVYREIVADLDTPLTVFAKIAGRDSHAFLFESLEGGEKWGRYSFIGLDPIATFESRQDQISIIRNGKQSKTQGDPLVGLKNLLASFRASGDSSLPRFFGGAVSFLGYDMVRFMEDLPTQNPALNEFPDSSFMIPRILLVCDNFRQTLTIVNCAEIPPDGDHEAIYREACRRIDEIVERLKVPLPYDFLESSF